ncbi:hypothetical protein HUU53_02485 [Candidatus Micrarchaeota archaeon]|nr:hypothetical protein [Candidatus Micrarchaeota archaeon]
MIKSFLGFTSSYCSSCPPVKDFLSKQALSGQWLDATIEEDKAIKHEVMTLPTVIFFDESGQEIARANNLGEVRMVLTGD